MRASFIPFLKALILLIVAAFALPAAAQLAVPAKGNHIAAELVAAGPVVPGEELDLALLFRPEPGWHGYWKNPGDAGLGMQLEWQLPEGWKAGEPLYPVPHKLLVAGLMNHVYEGEYAVLVPLAVPANAAVANITPIQVEANWLACTEQICVPERATLTLRLASGQGPGDPRFDQWRAALPPLLDQKASFELTADTLRIAVPIPASLALSDPHVFLANEQLVDYAAAQVFRRDGDVLVAEIPRKGLAQDAQGLSGILKLDDQGNGITFEAVPGEVPTGGTLIAGSGGAGLAPLWVLVGGAFLGGLILNLMPCVFPILSLKAMTLARAGESQASARREGVAYTAGVMLACLALGGLLLALRAGGSEVGWAFQLQEPGVVVALLALAVAITANFAGVYELPSVSFTRTGGRSSAFATGLLAAFVATPCTGPFMAAAMGAALLLPWWQGLFLFGALGFGLALPFLLLGFVPALRRLLPKPGKWMDTFRRILAVPMGLVALALLWLTWRLGGPLFAVFAVVVALAFLGILVMVQRRESRPWLFAAPAVAVLAAVTALVLPHAYRPTTSAEESLLAAVPFSEAKLAEARASGKPVFLWFTADWCLTCKVNEGVAIEREGTRDAFAKAGVVAMRGDWTRRDPAITRFLTEHGVAGVPLYVWYAPGKDGEILPQVLTPDSLIELAGKV
ncbi:protein-disulfide reductase DsbD family protein [Altererythrobacter sp. Root672]|uniref:protein-disulfide reductase DsbD family protein n=1 Tax=Altererythrobacter sp. Root672 TaxID=1736584 RepID=UPI0006FD033D|nr:protein-disulfide reductase DsbD domain-containing protein [Altererythrobacter sp. Root672]KRA82761.1 thiol:disulfide interchange protein [Altererythrobacter sp. Root672]